MSDIKSEIKDGITYTYLDQDECRIYFSSQFPRDLWELPKDRELNLEATVLRNFSLEKMEPAKRMGELYKGRQNDVVSILIYAHEQNRFEEFYTLLEQKYNDFKEIPVEHRLARTDLTAFVIGLYAKLGFRPQDSADFSRKFVEFYGPGLLVFPKRN